MRTSMLPLVDVVRGSRLLADQAIDTALSKIADVFDFYGRDLSANSGYALMIGETGYTLNYSKSDLQTSIEIGGYVPTADSGRDNFYVRERHFPAFDIFALNYRKRPKREPRINSYIPLPAPSSRCEIGQHG
jgi:hypothetical protein